MLKRNIRNHFIEKRLKLSTEELNSLSAEMLLHFNQVKLPPSCWLLSYYPLKERNEFDVSICETAARERLPGLQMAWPRIDADKLYMDAYPITQESLFAKNKYNILEPIAGERVEPELIDIIFVPLVIFDLLGYRVGYGKGFYDRFLLRCKPGVLKIGFCFFEAVDAIRDINEFDVPLSLCITPSRIYEF